METYFINCKMDDFDEFYILRCDEENVLWTGHKNAPDKDNLKEWFDIQLNNNRMIFLVRLLGTREAVGYLYLDIVGKNNNIIDISHGIYNRFKGNGLGTKNVKYAIEYTKNNLTSIDELNAWVARENFGSVKTFLNNGFVKTNENKMIFFQGINKEMEMQKFVYKIQR